jgi:hypothetical protein
MRAAWTPCRPRPRRWRSSCPAKPVTVRKPSPSTAAYHWALCKELEDYRDPLDWRDLADRFHAHHRRKATSFHADYAKGVAYRASVNKLTTKDRINLREFASTKRWRTA